MGPIVKDVSKKYSDKSIKFVTFDFTTDATKAEAEAVAKKLGVAELYKEHAPFTGFALVYDTKQAKTLSRLSAGDDVAAWSTVIEKALSDG